MPSQSLTLGLTLFAAPQLVSARYVGTARFLLFLPGASENCFSRQVDIFFRR